MNPDPLTLTAALLIGTLATARAVRLLTHDSYPPMQNLRVWYINHQLQREQRAAARGWGNTHPLDPRSWMSWGWATLVECPFCAAPYVTAVNLAWALTAGVSWDGFWSQAWWVVNVWAAVSYAAAMVVVRDEPADE